jgi:prepilin-type N-terminal cleavage/methylation domain-containing protein
MKKAFTLLELVFVIVVIGILIAIMLPKTKNNFLYEAAIQVQSHIRYTQHLAMMDDKYDSNDSNWFKKRWQIVFTNTDFSNDKEAYTIFADILGVSSGNPNEKEIALNPLNHNQRMTGGYGNTSPIVLDINDKAFVGMKKMNLGESYGVSSVTFSNSCTLNNSRRLAFDHFGRVIKSNLSSNTKPYDSNDLLQKDCNITLSNGSESVVVQVKAETGYVRIVE